MRSHTNSAAGFSRPLANFAGGEFTVEKYLTDLTILRLQSPVRWNTVGGVECVVLPNPQLRRAQTMFAKSVHTVTRPICLGLICLAGCSNSGSDQAPAPNHAKQVAELSLENERLIHDVGKMVAGPTVRHTFEVANKTSEKLTIEKPEDISINCGCSGVEPAKKVLEPGEKTDVTVALQTVNKNGPMSYGGTINWTSASGKKHAIQLLIRGTAIPAIVCDLVR
jgi:hypothetical protein